jgi:hypothetical protein
MDLSEVFHQKQLAKLFPSQSGTTPAKQKSRFVSRLECSRKADDGPRNLLCSRRPIPNSSFVLRNERPLVKDNSLAADKRIKRARELLSGGADLAVLVCEALVPQMGITVSSLASLSRWQSSGQDSNNQTRVDWPAFGLRVLCPRHNDN